MKTSILVPPQRNSPEGKTHSRSLQCDGGQAFQTQSSDSNRVVPISAGVQSFVLQMDPTTSRLVCNPVQSQTSSVCITGSGSLGSRRPQSSMGKFGRVRLSSSLSSSPGGCQDDGSGLAESDSHCTRLAKCTNFLLHLFKERNLQPSTIEGYRTAIADMIGNVELNISKDENLTHLLDSFHRDKRKGRRGVPSWNLSLVLHQLPKAPFEPLRKASLKHLTFKTVFLLALGSGKKKK